VAKLQIFTTFERWAHCHFHNTNVIEILQKLTRHSEKLYEIGVLQFDQVV